MFVLVENATKERAFQVGKVKFTQRIKKKLNIHILFMNAEPCHLNTVNFLGNSRCCDRI